jgi:NADPH:quinone reductase-like Zn-dependent oxidoreductase
MKSITIARIRDIFRKGSSMKAIVLEEFGDVDKLRIEDIEDPSVGAGEVLVRVRATSINPVDWKIRSGALKGRIDVALPAILGRDLAGDVERTGADVVGFTKGQRVMALANGTYAELTPVKADVLAPIPDALSFEQAAALPLVVLTGSQLIERAVKLQHGETVLILGALGGVGRSALYVARQHSARVIAGVRRNQVEEARSLGVDSVVAIDDDEEFETLHDLDAVADTIGGAVAERALKVLKKNGVLGTVLEIPRKASQYQVQVVTMMARPDASRLYELADDVAKGKFTIPIAKVLPFEKIQEAQKEAENHKVHGKIVLQAA